MFCPLPDVDQLVCQQRTVPVVGLVHCEEHVSTQRHPDIAPGQGRDLVDPDSAGEFGRQVAVARQLDIVQWAAGHEAEASGSWRPRTDLVGRSADVVPTLPAWPTERHHEPTDR